MIGRRFVTLAFVAVLALAGTVTSVELAPARTTFSYGPASVADLAERLSPAVVNISTSQQVEGSEAERPQIPNLPEDSPFRDFFDEFFNRQQEQGEGKQQRRPRRVNSLGSGFVIDSSGIVITNNHVIEKADEITVNFADGNKLKAEVVGVDPKTDLAVLKVKPVKPLVAVPFGNSEEIRVGDWVMAIGNPFGLGGSVTVGIVSARNRNINSGPYDDYLQTDAAINRGNSGGPLFNMNGEVIGINTAIISPSGGSIGIGFAVPAATAVGVVKQLREFGETRRGWLGVRIQTVTDEMVQSLGLDRARGALVADVTATGPSEKAGIKAGDVIVAFDGRAVDQMRDLPRIVAETPVGETVKVEVVRQGEKMTFDVVLGRLEEGEKLAAARQPDAVGTDADPAEVLGMTLSPITDSLRERFKLNANAKGALVTAVDPNSPAAEKRIEPGDIIAEADSQEIAIPADVADRVKQLKDGGRSSILLLVLKGSRNGDPHFIALRLPQG